MLSLASQLVSLGCNVTFLKAEKQAPTGDPRAASTKSEAQSAQSVAPSMEYEALSAKSQALNSVPTTNEGAAQERLRFVTLPARNNALSVDPKTVTRHQIFKNTLAGLEERQDLVASIVEESKASFFPITCIICDLLIWKWVRHVARAHRLRSAVFCIVSALTFYTACYLDPIGKEEEIEEIIVSQFGMPSKKDPMAYYGLSNLKDSPEVRLQKRKFNLSLFEGLEEANPILVNSFETLESPLLPSLHASPFDVRFIGPCLPKWHKDDVSVGSSMVQQAGSIFMEDEACLTWLDRQGKGSVLFVSFGSEGDVDAKQIEEIEMGIKESGHKFLWVVRPNALASSRPKHGLSEQINGQERGMFVSWAPQIKVLQHLAVGGFLTHSGWNSTLESVTFGVPMLCLPLFGDHARIANFVHKYLQVGLRLGSSLMV